VTAGPSAAAPRSTNGTSINRTATIRPGLNSIRVHRVDMPTCSAESVPSLVSRSIDVQFTLGNTRHGLCEWNGEIS
jgi:hypothetical protein